MRGWSARRLVAIDTHHRHTSDRCRTRTITTASGVIWKIIRKSPHEVGRTILFSRKGPDVTLAGFALTSQRDKLRIALSRSTTRSFERADSDYANFIGFRIREGSRR